MTHPDKIIIRERQIKSCDRCGAPITFAQNQAGKWLCVDVVRDRRGDPMWRRSGAYNNFIPTHQCSNAFAANPVISACHTYSRVYKCLSDQLVNAVQTGIATTPDFQDSVKRFEPLLARLSSRIARRLERSGLTQRDIDRNLYLKDALRAAGQPQGF